MHPELLSSLATERRRDVAAAMTASSASAPARAGWRAPRVTMPRFRVSWTRTTLAAVAGSRRRGSSLVIIISATRTSGPGAGQAAVGGSTDRRSLARAL
jgi:hypothetical protein